jgi:tetratricopeptide (TPR) repeat protein
MAALRFSRAFRLSNTIVWAVIAASAPLGAAIASGGGGGMGGGMSAPMSPSMSTPQYDPAQEYRDGMAAYQDGKFKDAARSFEHVTQAAPGEANSWRMLGLARSGANDAKGAAKSFERALKIDPKAVDTRRDYALALAQMKQADKASAQLTMLKTRAAACNDTCPEAADLKAAISQVEAALKPPEGTAPAPAASIAPTGGLLSAAAGDGAYVEAVSLINEHRYGDALVALDRASAAFGPHPDILTYRGYVWRKLGQLDKAEQYYRAALAIAPWHRGATEYYGELKVIEGDMAGARTMLAKLERQCAFGCVDAEDLQRWIDHGGDPAS